MKHRFTLILALILTIVPFYEVAARKNKYTGTGIVAHRGFWNCEEAGYAKNSIASLRCAQQAGVWGSEFDVNMTADSVLIVFHDSSIDGKKIEAYTPRELSEKVGVVLTERENMPDLTIEEVVAIGRMPYTNFWGRLTADDRRAVDEAIALVGIEALRHKKIGRVSDGERQKTMIAKALAQQTGVILLDEPTAFLDYGSKVSVMRLLNRLAHEQGKSILLSTHDLEIAFQTADEVWILQREGLQTGTLDDLEQRGAVSEFLATSGLHYEAEQRRIVFV